ncbi:uncharacterized protein RHOBADRAFT_54934 [Rhodotorula graminis WP1]|uniref:Transcriptional regulator of RNA polII, SAGA, subunit-domain-containing protein n=1 Tax=Rhodotorula graminis (strain WP1) TaxID=578459 RepID=A0A0N8Q001_RHOGW|nr:uncharacterized protein RHOBADRAFT_54934 [Rhodotorula graminis WP1]KPV73749.1 hypothetical protein RHOBADRAFT_54934 [Rhodotorula graminis WP1]
MASPAAVTPAGPPAPAPAASTAITSIAALLPAPAHPPPKRTDTVALKLRLAELLDPDHGHLYWTGLGDFVAARINRAEWDDVLRRAFGPDQAVRDQAFKLHNALLLSILYNTTRPFLPPSSVRHSGFHPRGAKKRGAGGLTGDGAGLASAAEDKRRRLLRDKVMSLGRRERAEVKLLGSATAAAAAAAAVAHKGKLAKEGADAEERRRRRLAEGDPLGEAVGAASRGGGARVDQDGVPRALRDRERQGATLPATLAQDYGRYVQLPLCCESRMLPDAETLRERMVALAYEEGMPDGVEARSAALVQGAIEHHLRNMIASVISLVRGTRPASPPPLPRTAASSTVSTPVPPSASTFAPAGAAPPAPVAGSSSLAAEADDPSSSTADDLLPERTPLTIADFHALFAISPSLLGQHPTSAAVERMYAIAPPGSDSDSDDCSSDDDHADDERDATAASASARARAGAPARDAEGDTPMLGAAAAAAVAGPSSSSGAATGQGAGKHPRLSRSRASSFYGTTRPVRASTGGSSPAVAASSSASSTSAAVPPHVRALAPGASAGGAGASSKPQRFVLDPSSTHGVPSGHPDVPPLRPTPAPLLPAHLGGPGGASGAAPGAAGAHGSAGAHGHGHGHGAGGGGAGGGASSGVLSPKSLALRNSLFPELAPSAPGSGSATPGPGGGPGAGPGAAASGGEGGDGNGTSTDAGSDSEDDVGASAHVKRGVVGAGRNPGFKIKLGSSALSGGAGAAQQQGVGAGAAGGGRAMPTNERDKEAGRKLWEVVDSVGLLDGVLQ